DWNGGLYHRWAAIQFRGHKMYRCAMFAVAGFKGTAVSVQAGVERQQRWVDVEHAPQIVGYQSGSENPHKSSQHHQIWRIAVNHPLQLRIKSLAAGKRPMV